FIGAKHMEVQSVALTTVYRLPGWVVRTLPIAVLYGTLLSLGRLAKDSELTVLLSTGTPFRKVAAPILLLAALVSAACFFLNEWVVPASNQIGRASCRERGGGTVVGGGVK